MTYDSSISTEVSLSKILDQMILDNTPIDIIVQFLESHDNCVEDIFSNSVFAYGLFDVATSYSFPDERLEKYICFLPPISMFFVLTSCVDLALELDLPEHRKKYAHMLGRNLDARKYLLIYDGFIKDREGISDGIDFITNLENIITKHQDGLYDLDYFLKHSHFLESALSYNVFVNLSPTSQWVLIKNVIMTIDDDNKKCLGSRFRENRVEILTWLLMVLMKQLLCSGHVDLFKYIQDMLSKQAKADIKVLLFNSLPETIRNGIFPGGLGFEEIVFEMNMVDSTFDTLNLFLYVCLYGGKLRKAMIENLDLLEFFNLPFDYVKCMSYV